jgi:hypothetical protein
MLKYGCVRINFLKTCDNSSLTLYCSRFRESHLSRLYSSHYVCASMEKITNKYTRLSAPFVHIVHRTLLRAPNT